jgi:N utilization substance protein B
LIFDDLSNFANLRIEEAKRKRIPTKENLNPNMRFVDNKLIAQLSANASLKKASEKASANWIGDIEQDMLKKMFIYLRETDLFLDYMQKESSDYKSDKNFIVQLFKKEICNFELLHNFFEDRSIYWQDDMDHICSMVLKTLKSFEEDTDESHSISDLYKDDEKDYIIQLFHKSIKLESENLKMINSYTKNWDSDRLAKMDILLMNLAITEAKEFSSIPLKVTLNEYIEISKFYSTPKSNGFINGVLDKVFIELKNDGAIKKVGRGLME